MSTTRPERCLLYTTKPKAMLPGRQCCPCTQRFQFYLGSVTFRPQSMESLPLDLLRQYAWHFGTIPIPCGRALL